MKNHDLLEALKVTRTELERWHSWCIGNREDYRLSDGGAQCAKVLDIADHAIEQADKPEQGQDTQSQYVPAVFMDLLSAAHDLRARVIRAQAYLDANGPGRGDPEVEAAQSARIQELFSENTIARRQLAGAMIDLERLKLENAGNAINLKRAAELALAYMQGDEEQGANCKEERAYLESLTNP